MTVTTPKNNHTTQNTDSIVEKLNLPKTPTSSRKAKSADQFKDDEVFLSALLSLPYEAYLRLIGLLLEKLGYQNVEQAGRTDWKGRNRFGGFDLLATRPDLFTVLPGGIAPRRSVVQVKQFDNKTRIFQRHVDELRGAAIRAGASEAILFTTGPISSVIDPLVLTAPILPVQLVGRAELLTLLHEYQVGITLEGELDRPMLERLTNEARGNGRGDCNAASKVEDSNRGTNLTFTVEIVTASKER